MSPEFTVGAIAVAARRANAIGAVRITCASEGLDIELIRISSFEWGFAPAGIADRVSFLVPYAAVRGVVSEGPALYLALDPLVITPYNRFALARFADDPAEVLASAFRARVRARLASLLIPPPVGLLCALLAPGDLAAGALGRASFGALATLVVWMLLRRVVQHMSRGGPREDRLRDALEAELVERVGAASRGPAAVAEVLAPVRAEPVRFPRLRRGIPLPAPRSARVMALSVATATAETARRLLMPIAAATATAVGAVVAMLFLQRHGGSTPPPPPVPRLVTGLGEAVRAFRIVPEPKTRLPRCTCTRADSPLWKQGVPKVAMLIFEGESAAGVPTVHRDRRDRPHYDFDLAVVNDAATPVRDVRVTLTFARRTEDGRRVGAVDRGLFWEGALAPGRAVKWHVKAPGSEMRIDASVGGTLADAGLEPAPGDAFFKLTTSHFRAVRLHAAFMLAYVGDPRATDVARALGAQSAADNKLLSRIRRASSKVIACDVHRENGFLDACVFNASAEPKGGLVVRDAPAVPGEPSGWTLPVEVPVPVHDGLRLHAPYRGDSRADVEVVDPEVAD